MTSYLNNGYDVTKYFAKFEKFIPHSIIMASFMTVGSQMPQLDWGGGLFPPYKIACQSTPYKLGLTLIYMGFFDYLFYMGAAKEPPPSLTLGSDFR